MRARRVQFAREATDQARSIDAWWREHRPSAPELFVQELSAAIALLEAAPKAGTPYPHERRGVRRVLLRSSRYHVYYRHRNEEIVVIAIWSSARGAGPDLSRTIH